MLTRQVASAYTIQILPEKTIQEQKASYQKLLDFLAERETAEPEEGLTDTIIARLEERIEASGS